MKSLLSYLIESEDKEENSKEDNIRKDIMFTIWKEPKTKVKWLKDHDYTYQKIEYQHRDKDNNIEIDFLLGYIEKEKTWKLWVGKIGSTNYDDDPYYDCETEKFSEAIIKSLDKIEDFIKDVQENKDNWVQFYKD